MKKILLMLLIIAGSFMLGCASGQNEPVPGKGEESKTEVMAINEEDAKNIVLAQVSGAAEQDIREFWKDYDDGRLEYEGKIIYEGIEYEFEVDGYSGAVLVWEAEPVND